MTDTISPIPDATAITVYALGENLGEAHAAPLEAALRAQGLELGARRVHAGRGGVCHAWAWDALATVTVAAARDLVRELADRLSLDLVVLPRAGLPKAPGLIVMDMDSTVITIEVIDELAKLAGVGDEVVAITAAAMRGELDFAESLRRRVALLRGLSRSAIDVVADRLPLNRGAEALVDMAKARGCKLALVSGGFTYFAERLAERLGLDFVAANRLCIADEVLTGELEGQIVDAERKAELLRRYAAELGLSPEQTVAVGDGANDLKMLAAAGLGIALHAKPRVQAQASAAINHLGLEGVAYLLGWC